MVTLGTVDEESGMMTGEFEAPVEAGMLVVDAGKADDDTVSVPDVKICVLRTEVSPSAGAREVYRRY